MSDVRVVTADDLCDAAATILGRQLPPLIAALGLDDVPAPEKSYVAPTAWTQVPTLEALNVATFPAGAITSPGIIGPPVKSSLGFDATWRVIAGVYDRDTDYNVTAKRIRTWAALIRAVLVGNPTLGGVAIGTQWRTETYQQTPQRTAARTLGGCTVGFDVTARNVVDLGALDPLVLFTESSVTVRPPQE